MASLLDIQTWYVKASMSQTQFPPERIATTDYSDYAAAEARAVRAREQGQQAAGLPLKAPRRGGA